MPPSDDLPWTTVTIRYAAATESSTASRFLKHSGPNPLTQYSCNPQFKQKRFKTSTKLSLNIYFGGVPALQLIIHTLRGLLRRNASEEAIRCLLKPHGFLSGSHWV